MYQPNILIVDGGLVHIIIILIINTRTCVTNNNNKYSKAVVAAAAATLKGSSPRIDNRSLRSEDLQGLDPYRASPKQQQLLTINHWRCPILLNYGVFL